MNLVGVLGSIGSVLAKRDGTEELLTVSHLFQSLALSVEYVIKPLGGIIKFVSQISFIFSYNFSCIISIHTIFLKFFFFIFAPIRLKYGDLRSEFRNPYVPVIGWYQAML